MPDPIIRTSYLGTPIMSNVVFKAPKANNENEAGQFNYLEKFTLDHVLVSIRQAKQIVKTQVEGMEGTIKEYISLGDYEITINGKLVNEEDPFAAPRAALNDLLAFLNYGGAIEIASKATKPYGIRSVVVMDYVVNEQAGVINEYPIRIRLLSDTPEEIQFQQFSG